MLSLTLIIDETLLKLLYKQFLSSRSTINFKINIDLKCVSMQCNYITEMGLVLKFNSYIDTISLRVGVNDNELIKRLVYFSRFFYLTFIIHSLPIFVQHHSVSMFDEFNCFYQINLIELSFAYFCYP